MREIEPHKIWRRLGGIAHEMVVIGPHYGDKEVANRVAQPHRPERHQWTVGGRRSRTSTVMRTANTPSENAFSRSGVLLLPSAWSPVSPSLQDIADTFGDLTGMRFQRE